METVASSLNGHMGNNWLSFKINLYEPNMSKMLAMKL